MDADGDPDYRHDDRDEEGYYNTDSAMKALLRELDSPTKNFDEDFVPEEKKQAILAEMHAKTGIHGTFNTGAKGVINDYKQAKDLKRQQLELEQQQIRDAIKQQSITLDAKEDDSDSFDIDSDDEIFAAIREARMKELQRMGSGEREEIAQGMKNAIQEANSRKKVFKTYPRLSQAHFVDFIEKEAPDVTVVVHLFQSHLGLCMRLNSCLEDLSCRYPGTKFGKILSTDAHAGLNFRITDDVLPVLQIYQNGQLVQQLENIGEELRSGFDVDDVDQFLQEKGVVDKSDGVAD